MSCIYSYTSGFIFISHIGTCDRHELALHVLHTALDGSKALAVGMSLVQHCREWMEETHERAQSSPVRLVPHGSPRLH